MLKNLVLILIRLYQRTLSLDRGPFRVLRPHGQCKFYPTCSEYTYQAIEKLGVARGLSRAIWRLLRCNPFSNGGFDPV